MPEMDKEKWIDGIINSIDGIQQAAPSVAVFQKIEQRIAVNITHVKTIPLYKVTLAAASIILLVVLNLFFVTEQKPDAIPTTNSADAVIEYYGLTDDKIVPGL